MRNFVWKGRYIFSELKLLFNLQNRQKIDPGQLFYLKDNKCGYVIQELIGIEQSLLHCPLKIQNEADSYSKVKNKGHTMVKQRSRVDKD